MSCEISSPQTWKISIFHSSIKTSLSHCSARICLRSLYHPATPNAPQTTIRPPSSPIWPEHTSIDSSHSLDSFSEKTYLSLLFGLGHDQKQWLTATQEELLTFLVVVAPSVCIATERVLDAPIIFYIEAIPPGLGHIQYEYLKVTDLSITHPIWSAHMWWALQVVPTHS